MGAVVKTIPVAQAGEIAPGRVVSRRDAATLEVAIDGATRVLAQSALSSGIASPGDSVLIARDNRGDHYVLAVLGSAPMLRAVGGSSATLDGAPGHETLTVRDATGALLFEHRAGEGRSVIHAPAGDLVFASALGGIEFQARDGVKIRSERDIDLAAGRKLNLTAPHVETVTRRADIAAEMVNVTSRVVHTTAEKARHVVGVLETTANRIVERARNVYRETEELAQTRAGRMRMVVKETFHLLGKRTLIRAEKDARVDGEKIYLG